MNLEQKRAYVQENINKVSEEQLRLFNFNFDCVFTKNSCCMEGPDIVSIEDVVSIIRGYQVRTDEMLKRSIYNHYKAFQMVRDQLEKTNEITEDFVKDLHEVLVDGLSEGGLYRNTNLRINGSKYIPCDYVKVYDRMKKYYINVTSPFDIVTSARGTYSTVLEKIAYAHLEFSKIHPFLDGNGRLARLILNYLLMANGYAPIVIRAKHKERYFECLEAYKVDKTPQPFLELLDELLNKEYDRMIDLIDRK